MGIVAVYVDVIYLLNLDGEAQLVQMTDGQHLILKKNNNE